MTVNGEHKDKSYFLLHRQWYADYDPVEQSQGASGVCPQPLEEGSWDGVTQAQLIEHADKVLKPIKCVGLNPYKIVEMYKNYRSNVPIEYHSDVMYVEPSEEVWSVKVEKKERSEFRANLREKKYAEKEQIESVAFGDGEAKM